MNHRLYAVQQIRRLRGGSQAQLLRASDGAYYVAKSAQNPQHVRVLANEMLATRLGQVLGLPVPRVEPIEVSGWLIEHTSELSIETGVTSIGLGNLACTWRRFTSMIPLRAWCSITCPRA